MVIKTRLNSLLDTRPLCIRLPQMTGYARKFDENATMSFIVKDKQLLKNILKYGKQLKG